MDEINDDRRLEATGLRLRSDPVNLMVVSVLRGHGSVAGQKRPGRASLRSGSQFVHGRIIAGVIGMLGPPARSAGARSSYARKGAVMPGQSARIARVVGPLSKYADELRGELDRLGYAPGSAENQMRWVALLSRWMRAEHVDVNELDEQTIPKFLACARATGVRRVRTAGSLRWLLSWLESHGALSCSRPGLSWPDTLLAEYTDWLQKVQGASPSTVRSYLYTAHLALDSWPLSPGTGTGVDITARDVREFVLSQSCRGLAPGTLYTRLAVSQSGCQAECRRGGPASARPRRDRHLQQG
ncbi:MAG: hypothetical protein ACYDEY_10220 [Acidimicrobiales bacterium]